METLGTHELAVNDFLRLVPVAALVIRDDGVVLFANGRARELLGREDVTGNRIEKLLDASPGDLADPEADAQRQARVRGRTLLIRSTPAGADRRLVVLVDVTSFERGREEAEEAARSQTDFVARLSHEIRSALASMIGFAEMMKESAPEAKSELIENITSSGRHVVDTLNSVMDLARAEAGKDVEMRDVDAVSRVRDRVAVFGPTAKRKGLRLAFEPDVETACIRVNPTFLDRIVHNLIDNAVRYTPEGTVEVDVEKRDDRVWIYVADTGIGMSRAFLPKLFSAFEREQNNPEVATEGTGLGLAITKQLVELMGGRIYACSTRGEGSTFTVSFPAVERGSTVEARGSRG